MTAEAFVYFLAGWFCAAIVILCLASRIDLDFAECLSQDFTIFGMILVLLAVLAKILGG